MKTFRQLLEDGGTLDEVTTAGEGTGDYKPPLGLRKLTTKDPSNCDVQTLKRQLGLCVNKMDRSQMLSTTRKMGLTLHHLKDDDIKKTILSMSVRNCRKFMALQTGVKNKK